MPLQDPMVNPYLITGYELMERDYSVMAYTIVVHAYKNPSTNVLHIRAYRAPYGDQLQVVDGVPQGSRVEITDDMLRILFPTLHSMPHVIDQW